MSGEREFARRLRRAREMGLAGIRRRVEYRAHRAATLRQREQWSRSFEATGATDAALLDALTPAARAGGDDFGRLRDALGDGGARFFLPTRDGTLAERFRKRHPAAFDRILRESDATQSGDLSWVVPGGTNDWHAALPNCGRWPLDPAHDLAIGAAKPLGDVRLSWEIGRSTHVVRLAQAAWLTRDPAYARAVVAQLDDFVLANPPGRGIAWAHAQEVAIRAVAWLWAFFLTRDLGAFDAAAFRRWLWLILAHAEYVAAHLADHPITHNHLVSETAALAVLGMALPELRSATRWRQVGTRLLFREVTKLVDDEGVEAEYSTHYHAFVLDSLLAVLALAERSGQAVDSRVRNRIAAMTDFVALLMRPDGTLPAIGDTDAGRAWRLGGEPLDRRDALAAAAALFGRSDWGAIAGDAPGAFWLLGGRAIPGAGAAPPPGCARQFRAAGIGVARTDFGAKAEVAVFRCGATAFRSDVERGHLHADALSVVWQIGSDDVLVDPGTYLYSEDAGWRGWFRGTASHSCVVIDGRDQADVRSHRFGIAGERPSRWESFAGDATQMTAAAVHPANGMPQLRRRLAWLAGGTLVLCDDVAGSGEHRLESWLQFPETEGDADGNAVVLRLASGRAVRVQGFGDITGLAVLRPADAAGPGPGWRAPRYGTRTAGTSLRFDAGTRTLPARLLLLLQVGETDRTPDPGRIESDTSGSLRVFGAGFCAHFDGATAVRIERSA